MNFDVHMPDSGPEVVINREIIAHKLHLQYFVVPEKSVYINWNSQTRIGAASPERGKFHPSCGRTEAIYKKMHTP